VKLNYSLSIFFYTFSKINSKEMIKFKQKKTDAVEAFEKDFSSFDEARNWIALDKVEEYGDALAYGGTFVGLTAKQSTELQEMTYEDAIEIIGHEVQ
jgi:hypothetical protein